jgi:hypothetical protein
VPSGYTIDWYTTSDGTTLVSGGGSVTSISPSITSSTTYYAQSRNTSTGCVSTSRTEVTATVNPIPSAPTMAGSSSYCTSGTITATAGSGGNGIKWGDTGSTVSLRTVTTTGTYRAVTTSAAGCTSSSATKSVTIVQKGTSGNDVTACGCADGLNDCSGTCLTTCCSNCASWTTCAGFTEVSNVKSEFCVGCSYAINQTIVFCPTKGDGWRLPTRPELLCMCQNHATLPGGYEDGYYMSSTELSGTHVTVNLETCSSDIFYTYKPLLKCVK